MTWKYRRANGLSRFRCAVPKSGEKQRTQTGSLAVLVRPEHDFHFEINILELRLEYKLCFDCGRESPFSAPRQQARQPSRANRRSGTTRNCRPVQTSATRAARVSSGTLYGNFPGGRFPPASEGPLSEGSARLICRRSPERIRGLASSLRRYCRDIFHALPGCAMSAL